MTIQFKEKLTGAKGRLFAALCLHYIDAAENGCNDTPSEMPLFSWLSPHQRIHLVKELMVGLLCEDEPLPPGTIQHYAAYRGLVLTLKSEIIVELDTQWDFEDVGDDLRLDDVDHTDRSSYCSGEEIAERHRNFELIRHRAEKNKKKLDKKGDQDLDFVPEEKEIDMEYEMKRIQEIAGSIFDGPPLSREQREWVRRPTTDDEKHAFSWRCLCEEALQEDCTWHGFWPPLAAVNFDFRSNSQDKWFTALDLLFITFFNVKVDQKEHSLACGPIDERAYADKSQHTRIQAVKKHISILRQTYERTWDPKFLGEDQRCIFAVCSDELFYGYGHGKFVKDFVNELALRNIDFAKNGHYQERYNLYKELAPLYHEGLKHPFHAFSEKCTALSDCEAPADYKADDEESWIHCGRPECYTYKKEELRKCSQCHVVYYCSPACQEADWPSHKKDCKKMAKLRKDKAAIQRLAKDM